MKYFSLLFTLFLSMNAWAAQTTATGEVRRIDVQKGKVAIKHGAISAFQLPAMTLVYEISPDLLKGVKAGDQVEFTATQENNRYRVEAITVSP